MKRRSILLGLALVMLICFSACENHKEAPKAPEKEYLNVYASCFPIYAVAERLMRNVPDASIHCLIEPMDIDVSNYSLSDWDAALLTSADALLLGGNGLEGFNVASDGIATATVLSGAEFKKKNDTVNPHIYMRTDGLKEIAVNTLEALKAFDPKYMLTYEENYEGFQSEIDALHSEIEGVKTRLAGRKVIVMNDALLYTADEYGLSVALSCDRSTGEEMSTSEIDSFIDCCRQTDTTIVLIEKQCPNSIREALKREGMTPLYLDVLTTGSAAEGFDGLIRRLNDNKDGMETIVS